MSFLSSLDWMNLLIPLGVLAFFWILLQLIIKKINPETQPFFYHIRTSLSRLLTLSFLYFSLKHFLASIPFPENWERYSSFFLLIFVILGTTSILVKIAQNLIAYSADKDENPSRASSILQNFFSIVIWILGILILLNSAGIPITPLVTALGVGGLAVALALQDPMSNLFAGLQILMSQQIRLGDFIQLASGESGTIIDISWRTTVIQTIGKDIIIIPNNKIATATITNKTWLHSTSPLYIMVQVGYRSDLNRVKTIALETAKKVARDFGENPDLADEALIRLDSFGPSGVNLKVILKCNTPLEVGLLTDALIEQIHARFAKEEIEIPYSVQRILLNRNDNKDYLHN